MTTTSAYLNPLSRQKVHEALLGNTELMLTLIAEWDTEAQLLAACNNIEPQRLANADYLQAQLLGRLILARSRGLTTERPFLPRPRAVDDDTGRRLSLDKQYRRFLPQTYISASFLLTLSPPDAIVALPKGLRDHTQIYPTGILDSVPLDCSPYHTEVLYRARPDVAFVAPYTLPATRQALLDKGIELFTISRVNSFEEVEESLLKVGDVTDSSDEAQLLSYFMQAAICALNNRLIEANLYDSSNHDILYLNYYTRFSTPTSKTLTGSMFQRLGINRFSLLEEQREQHWQIPLEQERIVHLNPKAIILSAVNAAEVRDYIMNNPAFQQVSAVQHNNIFTVDPVVQDFSSQFAVLAYYDLVKSLLEARPAL